ncbi:hypothetical protein G7Y89_g8826 [Cudoniella acicularis]|uniref:Sur7 protein n=1 Tax=Cudoniella acicularis TaxID=354080 RepID=A0A8H4W2I7_9HELO|nr:hypothetical protein G7Y89_g8826 [Cudoniella acicularis]
MRFQALFPMLMAFVAFVLALLCMFAGNKPNFMEDYHIVSLNTSLLGHNLIPSASTTTSAPKSTSTSDLSNILGHLKRSDNEERNIITSGIDSGLSSLENDLNSLGNDVADKLARELGIKEWYSLHLMDMCEGTFTPNATAAGASKASNMTCSNRTAMYHFDITTPLNNELMASPLHINLTTLKFPDDIQKGLDALSTSLNATFVFYAMGIACAGTLFLTSILTIFFAPHIILLANMFLSILGTFVLMLASAIITVAQNKATDLINKFGNDVGLYAYKGGKFHKLTWVAFGFLGFAMVGCVMEWLMDRRARRNGAANEGGEKKDGLFRRVVRVGRSVV